jgi:hypothetical protein
VITYTVFDPDDGSGCTYWWYGDTMVYVHEDGREVDAFEVEHDETPAPDVIRAAIEARHEQR